MKLYKLSLLFILTLWCSLFQSCEENTTTVGSVIASGEVDITIETLEYQLNAKAIKIDNFDSKTGNLMIGNIETEHYGKLNCSFVTRLMCAANLQIPDSLFKLDDFINRVDSCKLILGANRDEIVGDSLAPQKLSVFQLTKALPSDINNTFNPEGYYNPDYPFATRSYTVSGIGEPDSAFYNNTFVDISVDLSTDFGKEIITKYKEEPQIFQWPQTMATEFPLQGFFVTPTFGKGCIANINSVYVAVFYYNLSETTTKDEEGNSVTKVSHVRNMVVPFTVSPEVLSSNNISYNPSEFIQQKNAMSDDGEVVLTTPGGYIAQFDFPAQSLIDLYQEKNTNLSTVNELTLYIPAVSFDSTDGIGVAQNILLVKTSEYEDFFNENRIPDNLTSFTGIYDPVNERYYFSSMRNYFLELLKKDTLTQDDINFTLVPIEIETETSSSYYNESTYVTKCVPYTSRPTMSLLKTNEASVNFSFSTQIIR